MDLDTGLLRAFVVTVEENHFGRAAGRLFITQQALSKRIKRLEEQLGVRLFERTNRRVELTDAGRRLLPAARDAIDAVDSAASAVSMGEGPVRIDVLFEYLAPVRWIRRAVDRDPTLLVEVSSRGNQRLAIPGLRRGDFDVAFGRAMADPWPADIRRRPAVLEPIGLLVGTKHELASRDQIRLAELARLRLFFPMAGAPEDWISLIQALSDQFGLKIDQPSTAMGFEHFLDRTAEDPQTASLFGLSMTPPDDRLRIVPVSEPIPAFAWSVMWRRRIPDTTIDRVLAGGHPDNAIPLEQLRDPHRVWLPAVDRAWWLNWLESPTRR